MLLFCYDNYLCEWDRSCKGLVFREILKDFPEMLRFMRISNTFLDSKLSRKCFGFTMMGLFIHIYIHTSYMCTYSMYYVGVVKCGPKVSFSPSEARNFIYMVL